jgi:hypothetical protein
MAFPEHLLLPPRDPRGLSLPHRDLIYRPQHSHAPRGSMGHSLTPREMPVSTRFVPAAAPGRARPPAHPGRRVVATRRSGRHARTTRVDGVSRAERLHQPECPVRGRPRPSGARPPAAPGPAPGRARPRRAGLDRRNGTTRRSGPSQCPIATVPARRRCDDRNRRELLRSARRPRPGTRRIPRTPGTPPAHATPERLPARVLATAESHRGGCGGGRGARRGARRRVTAGRGRRSVQGSGIPENGKCGDGLLVRAGCLAQCDADR